jgi:hypothetical protein
MDVKITTPNGAQTVSTGILTILGTSTANSASGCQVYVGWHGLKPQKMARAIGPNGNNDYSNWTFTYTKENHVIMPGINILTAQLSCLGKPTNFTSS